MSSTEGQARPPGSFPCLDLYLFRQKVLALSPTYEIFDRDGNACLHVVRPLLYGRTFLAMGASILTLVYFFGLAYVGYGYTWLAPFVLIPMGLLASSVVNLLVQPYRHVYVFSDDSRTNLLLAIIQERKFVIITAPYTLVDGGGQVLAAFRKNYLYNLFRRRWQVLNGQGQLLCVAWEDSIWKSILRRIVGPLYGILRTNFIITRSGEKLGEFNRQFTIFDRYVLDLRADPAQTLDRRVALALGVLLDTAEGR